MVEEKEVKPQSGEPGKDNVVDGAKKKSIPAGLWTKCPECEEVIFNKSLQENLSVCQKCGYHFTIGAFNRIKLLIDEDTFKELNANLVSADPLKFEGSKSYLAKLSADQKKTGLKDAVITV